MIPVKLACSLAVAAAWLPMDASAQVRAKADVACQPTAQSLAYDCAITLTDLRTGEPLSGVTLTVGADMPSMPMMHNVQAVKATAEQEPGRYRARLVLEMHGDWALQLNISGASRDRVVAIVRFEPGRAIPEAPSGRKR